MFLPKGIKYAVVQQVGTTDSTYTCEVKLRGDYKSESRVFSIEVNNIIEFFFMFMVPCIIIYSMK